MKYVVTYNGSEKSKICHVLSDDLKGFPSDRVVGTICYSPIFPGEGNYYDGGPMPKLFDEMPKGYRLCHRCERRLSKEADK